MILKRLVPLLSVSPSLSQYPINPDEKEEENRIVVKNIPTRGNGGRFTYYENNKVPYSRNKLPLPQTPLLIICLLLSSRLTEIFLPRHLPVSVLLIFYYTSPTFQLQVLCRNPRCWQLRVGDTQYAIHSLSPSLSSRALKNILLILIKLSFVAPWPHSS